LNIKEAAANAGLTTHTIRFYEQKGILPAPPRSANGYREYAENHVATLRLAKGLRELELPLDDVAAILRIAHDGTCGEVRQNMMETFVQARRDIDLKVAELEQAREHLDSVISGLRRMRPRDTTVPGINPCECVRMVTAGQTVPTY